MQDDSREKGLCVREPVVQWPYPGYFSAQQSRQSRNRKSRSAWSAWSLLPLLGVGRCPESASKLDGLQTLREVGQPRVPLPAGRR